MQYKKRLISLLAVFSLIAAFMPQTAFAAAFQSEFGAQLDPGVNEDIGEWPDMSEYGAFPDFDYDEEVTLSFDFGAPVKFGGNYAAINTSAPYPGSAGRIVSFKLDGEEAEMGDAYLNNEGIDGGLRLTVCNKWNGDIEEQPIDIETLPEFTTLELTFVVYESDEVPEESDEPAASTVTEAFDPNGAYWAHLGIQTPSWSFRNTWHDASYGIDGASWADSALGESNFYGITGWDEGNNAIAVPGVFTDVDIEGNGTYRVELNDFDFGGDEFLNQLFVSTNIPNTGDVTITDVKVIMGGTTRHTFEEAFIFPPSDSPYTDIGVINIWNAELGGNDGLFGYTMPASGPIAIEFTISGFAYDKPEEEAPEEETETADDNPYGADYVAQNPNPEPEAEPDYVAPETVGEEESFPVWIIIVAVVGVAAIVAVIVSSAKRKK